MKFLPFLFLILSFNLFAQEKEKCGVYHKYYQKEESRAIIEKHLNDFHLSGYNRMSYDTSVKYIPTVVHIIHNDGDELITEEQIKSQVKVLNQDYRRLNSDTLDTPDDFKAIATDTKIEFFLANKDENGNCTNGIIYYKSIETDHNSYNTYDLTKLSRWDVNKYLNIWVVKDIDGGNNILAYAQSPGLSASTDGFVIDNNFFGTTGTIISPYNKGRTATHELGHWLGLTHLWGLGAYDGTNCDDDDGVDDTPNQNQAHFDCDVHPSASCSNNGDMFMNYLDYSDDGCMNSFTQGQKDLMHYTLSNNSRRANVVDTSNVNTTGFYIPEIKYDKSYGCENTTFNLNIVGTLVDSVAWYLNGSFVSNDANTLTITLSAPANYTITAHVFGGECLSDTISKMIPIYGCALGDSETIPKSLSQNNIYFDSENKRIRLRFENDSFRKVNLINLLGQTISTHYIEGDHLNISTTALIPGIYLINVFENKQLHTDKLTIY